MGGFVLNRKKEYHIREHLVKRIKEVTEGVAKTYRCEFEYEVLSECPSVVTDETVTAKAIESMKQIVPAFHIMHGAHGMGSEDFAEITERVPSAYVAMDWMV